LGERKERRRGRKEKRRKENEVEFLSFFLKEENKGERTEESKFESGVGLDAKMLRWSKEGEGGKRRGREEEQARERKKRSRLKERKTAATDKQKKRFLSSSLRSLPLSKHSNSTSNAVQLQPHGGLRGRPGHARSLRGDGPWKRLPGSR
jgi:hypothetical protein